MNKKPKQSVLVVDDEPDILELLEITLDRMGLEVTSADSFQGAVQALNRSEFDFCITDMRLPDGDGITLVRFAQDSYPDLPIAVITAHGSMELAIDAMKAGAYDFVSKPVSLEKLRALVKGALESKLPADLDKTTVKDSRYELVGKSEVIENLRKTIKKFARSQAPVFIEGPSGSGKELVARQIHAESARAKHPFIPVNCGAIPHDLMESEFFGHLKGSFTGAITDNPGIFRSAEGGTVFLDEIGDLPLNLQVKLLRVLQEKSIRPVGAHQEEAINVRFISASHKKLSELVNSGNFRHDLYYRINVISIQVPSLREHPEDIELIAQRLLGKLESPNSKNFVLQASALSKLRAYSFPGNVRELENILERACALAESESICSDDLDLPEESPQMENEASLTEKTMELETSEIEKALITNRWNQSAAARDLGITLRQLRYRCQKLGLTK